MNKRSTQFVSALLASAFLTPTLPALAQDIVIDSGNDETVISRLPNAGNQQNPVCSNPADGALGNCPGVPLGFYLIAENHEIEGSGSLSNRGAFCDEGDMAISAGYGHGLDPDLVVTAVGVSQLDPRKAGVDFIAPSGETVLLSVSAVCADYPPLHVP